MESFLKKTVLILFIILLADTALLLSDNGKPVLFEKRQGNNDPEVADVIQVDMKRAIEIGLENNLKVSLNMEEEKRLDHELSRIQSLFWPRIRAEYSYNILDYSDELQSVLNSGFLGFTTNSEYTNLVRIFLDAYVYTWGKNTRKNRIGEIQLNIQKILTKECRKNLIYEITKNYFTVIYNKVMFTLCSEYIGSFKALFSYAESEEDKLILEDDHGFLKDRLFFYEKELAISIEALKRSMGIQNVTPPVVIEISEKFFPFEKKKFERIDAVSLAISNRDDKQVIEKDHEILKNRLSIKMKEYMPDVRIIGEWDWIDYRDSTVNAIVDQDSQGMIGIVVDIPLFDGFERSAEIGSIKSSIKQNQMKQKQKIRDIVYEVEQSLLLTSRYYDSCANLMSKTDSKRKLLSSWIKKFSSKEISLEKLSNFYLKVFSAEEMKNKHLMLYNLSLADLYKSIGIIATE